MISDFHLGVNESVHFTWHRMVVCYQCSRTTSQSHLKGTDRLSWTTGKQLLFYTA